MAIGANGGGGGGDGRRGVTYLPTCEHALLFCVLIFFSNLPMLSKSTSATHTHTHLYSHSACTVLSLISQLL